MGLVEGFRRLAFGRLVDVGPEELLAPVVAAYPALKVGWPDDESARARVRDVSRFQRALIGALGCLTDFWGADAPVALDVDVNDFRRRLEIRAFACSQQGVAASTETREEREERARQALSGGTAAAVACAHRAGGEGYLGFGGSYLHLSLPGILSPGSRVLFPELPDADWDAVYRTKLEKATWATLRSEAYRFCDLASALADWARSRGFSRALVPSVGLCVHPWLFAERGIEVVATDSSSVAINTVANPLELSRMYGASAKRRWEISEAATYGGRWPFGFERMPALEELKTAERLARLVDFSVADWTAQPVETGSIDLIFATNALPRDDRAELERVLKEWARVVRAGGLVFCVMHNAMDLIEPIKAFSSREGWQEVNVLRADEIDHDAVGVQLRWSSG